MTAGYFCPMDQRLQLESFLASNESRFEIRPDGRLTDINPIEAEADAVLVVASPTDALKQVAVGRVRESLDRGGLWEVLAFSLSRDAVAALLAGSGPITDLLSDVPSAGYEWEVIESPYGPEEPNR